MANRKKQLLISLPRLGTLPNMCSFYIVTTDNIDFKRLEPGACNISAKCEMVEEQRWASLPKFGNRYRYLPQPELLKAQSQLRSYFADLRTATRNSATPQLRYPHLLDTYV